MRRELRDDWIRGLERPEAGRLEAWDSRFPGLSFRLTPKGVVTWTLGTWPAVGTVEARKRATKALAAVQAGADPSADKRAAKQARQARAAEATVTTKLATWRAAHASGPRAWSNRYAREVERICTRYIEPALGNRVLRETNRSDWTGLVAARRSKTPAMAALLYRVVSSFLNHAEAQGRIEASLLPRKGAATLAPPPASRARVLSDQELREVWSAALAEEARPRTFLLLLILCAVRAKEAAGIATDELDLSTGRWHVPATRAKNRRGYTVPLPTTVTDLLRGLLPEGDPADAHRLLGAGSGPFQGFSKLKARLDAGSRRRGR